MGQHLINSFVLLCAECTTDMETIVKAMMQETKDIFDQDKYRKIANAVVECMRLKENTK